MFAIEGATGIGKSALMAQLSGTVRGESGHALAAINAAQRPSEELVVASIYQQLFKIDSAPRALFNKAVERFRSDLPGAVRKVFVALLADGLKLVTDKAENTIGALGEIAGGDGASSDIADQLLALDGDSRRYFIREFLYAIADIAGGAVIAIDNFDSADNSLVGFIRFLIKERPPRVRILLAHNSEVGDNSSWDNVVADLRAGGGKLMQLRSLDQSAVSSWFQDIFGRNPTSSELEELLAETHGRPYSIDLAFRALREGNSGGVKSDYSGYYERSRRRLSKDARAVAELLALLSRDTLIDSDLLAYAAECLNIDSLSSALDELIDQRLLRREDSYLGLAHSLAQETLQQTISQPRRSQLCQAWYTAVHQLPVVELASASAVGLLPAIVDPLCDNRSPSDVVQIGTRLIESGQVRAGLEFVDRSWRVADTGIGKADDVFNYAMLAAQTRLDIGRYREVDGPLAHAELMAGTADSKLAQVEILRMKLALRRNAYADLSPLAESIRGRVFDDLRLQVERELVLNVALRDLMDLGELSASRDRLLELRAQSDLDQQNSIDRALARSSAKLGDSDSALAFANSALQSSNDLSSIRAVGNANLAFGEASRYRKDYASAMEGYAKAVAIARATGNRDSLLWSLLGIVAGCIEQDDGAAATGPLEELDALLGEPGYEHPLETAHTALLHSLYASSEETGTNALQLYKQLGVVWPEKYLLDFFRNGRAIRTILL